MDLKNFFESSSGVGVLSTADGGGQVNSALFARPHIEKDKALFLTVERKNLHNLRQNPYAYYLFKVDGEGYEGVRLALKLDRIEEDSGRIDALRRNDIRRDIKTYLLEFSIIEQLPLVGSGD